MCPRIHKALFKILNTVSCIFASTRRDHESVPRGRRATHVFGVGRNVVSRFAVVGTLGEPLFDRLTVGRGVVVDPTPEAATQPPASVSRDLTDTSSTDLG